MRAMLALSLAAAAASQSLSLSSGRSGSGRFEPSCSSKEDFGWPRFSNRADLEASPWAAYFLEVYGELPEADQYPVCTYDFAVLNGHALAKVGLPKTPKTDLSELSNGDLYTGGIGFLMIYHDYYRPAPANTWIEVTHSTIPSELVGMWCWRTRGSGIWFNTGNTITFPTPADPAETHQEAIEFLRDGCSVAVSSNWPRYESDIFGLCAREKGYDSIQFEPTTGAKPVGTFGLPGLTELVITGLDGRYNCGVEDAAATPLRSGWQASTSCQCENLPVDEHCGLMPRAPGGFADPPICSAQARDSSEDCDPSACSPTACKVSTSNQVSLI